MKEHPVKLFCIVDGHSLLYRCHYAPFQALTAPNGEITKATYAFMQILLRIWREKIPNFLAVVFDTKTSSNAKKAIYPGYKNRSAAPREIEAQTQRCSQIIEALGAKVIHAVDFEADDIIASLATQFVDEEVTIVVVTQDKDFGALLVDPRIMLFNPHSWEYKNADQFEAKMGYNVKHSEAVLALAGDSSDDIPPVGNIGPKTASRLLTEYGSLKELINFAHDIEGKVGESLRACIEDGRLEMNLALATLNRKVKHSGKITDFRVGSPNFAAAQPIFDLLGFRHLDA